MTNETRRTLLIIIGGLVLLFYVFPRLYEKSHWELNPYDNTVLYVELRWFRTDRLVSVQWRRDSDGQLGWCAKGKDGEWYAFVQEYLGPDE